jgi:dihydroorotase
MRLLVKGGTVVDSLGQIETKADILIADGKIEAVGSDLNVKGAEIIDAGGKIVTPGLIDMHVHLREPGFEAKETIATGTRAAARGGFTSVACMPNTRPVADDQTVIKFIVERAKETGIVNVFPIGAVTKGSKGEELSEMADLKAYGAVAFSDDGSPVSSSAVMRRAMQYAKMLGLPVISHCEDKDLVAGGLMHEGYMSTVLGLRGIPSAAEEIMVSRDILLAELTGCPLHLAHISTAGSVRLVREAKARGLAVTAEATPHHFTLTDNVVVDYNTATKVNPPLRTDEDVAAVKQGLADGTIDVIATDHAPHTAEEKDVEYQYAPFGMVGLETAVGLIFTELIAPGFLTLSEAIKKITVNPAKILGINKGTLAVGADADITVIDPDLEENVDAGKFLSKGKNSPFTGRSLRGLPVMTVVGGRIVMREGVITV